MFKPGLAAAVGLAVLLAASLPSAMAAELYKLDKPHTFVWFTIDRLNAMSKVMGRFNNVDGEFMFDQNSPEKSSLKVTVRMDSLDSGLDRRDQLLTSPNFFNVKEFPEMKFESTKVERTGEKTGKITGNLTMLGVTKPVTFETVFNNTQIDARRPTIKHAGFSARASLNRSDFGSRYLLDAGGVQVVGDKVEIFVETFGTTDTSKK